MRQGPRTSRRLTDLPDEDRARDYRVLGEKIVDNVIERLPLQDKSLQAVLLSWCIGLMLSVGLEVAMKG